MAPLVLFWMFVFAIDSRACVTCRAVVVVVFHAPWSAPLCWIRFNHYFVWHIFYIPYWFTAAQSNLHWFCAHFEVTNVLVLVLYRHAMQNAMVAYPETRKARLRLPGKDVLRSEVKWSEFRSSLLTKLGERKLDAQILEVRCCRAVPFLTLRVACFLPTWWTLGQCTWYQYVATAAAPFSATQHDAVFTIIWYSMKYDISESMSSKKGFPLWWILWVVDWLPELPVFNKLPARKPICDPSVFQNLRFYPRSFSLMLVSLQLESSVKSEPRPLCCLTCWKKQSQSTTDQALHLSSSMKT